MDFFKSVFAADPDPSSPPHRRRSPPESPRRTPEEEEEEEEGDQQERDQDVPSENRNPSSPSVAAGWGSFGGLIKTFASKSESVIQTYRRDLEEFRSGLRKETVAIREVASRAVRDLPGSLEAGASAAQESLETVGQAIDDLGGTVWRGTTGIISHGKEALLAMDSATADSSDPSPADTPASAHSKRYSRFEAQVLAIQSDPSTFADEPEDAKDFENWRSEFRLEEKEEEIEHLLYENNALENLMEKIVPSTVDYESFWTRYYYRVHKLKQAEDARAKLVKRVISREEEEEDLSWEVDDDEEEEVKEVKEEKKEVILGENKEKKDAENDEESEDDAEKETKQEVAVATSEPVESKKPVEVSKIGKLEASVAKDENSQASVATADEEKPSMVAKADNAEAKGEDLTSKSDDNVAQEEKIETAGSCKDSDVTVVSSQPSMQDEEDLEWDEIEDLGEHDDKKVGTSSGSLLKVDLRKRLSAAEDDEDLSWDIEDDDEPVKP